MIGMRRLFLHLAALLGLLLVSAFAFHWLYPAVYDFPEAEPFTGSRWYDPYAEQDGEWLRVNLHAHSPVWGGITRGDVPLEQILETYASNGYDVIGISNYQSIRPQHSLDQIYLPVYEHGYGAFQQHQTVVGADCVSWYDFPFYQGTRQRQDVIRHLKGHAPLVILNHPNKNTGYSDEHLSRLCGYDGIEIRSRFSIGDAAWDAALSAGRAVWGFCSDDLSNLGGKRRDPLGWVLVRAPDRSAEAVIEAMRRGSFYGVWADRVHTINAVTTYGLEGETLFLQTEQPADSIRFIGQGGRVVHETKHTDRARYDLALTDSYVRTEIHTGNNILFLNPVHRYEGERLEAPIATVLVTPTTTFRIAGLLVIVVYLGLWRHFARRRAHALAHRRTTRPEEREQQLPGSLPEGTVA